MAVLSVDPGIRGCGVAFFLDRRLAACGYVRNKTEKGGGPAEAADMASAVCAWVKVLRPLFAAEPDSALAVEWPQVYQGSRQKGDPADLLALAGVDAALAALLPAVAVRAYSPREWKGQVPKDIMLRRINDHLTQAEREILNECPVPGSLRHNIVDAAGIGLFALGRLGA